MIRNDFYLKMYNKMRFVLVACVIFYEGVFGAIMCAYIQDRSAVDPVDLKIAIFIFVFTTLYCLWLLAVVTETITVKERHVIIRYLFFYKKTISIDSITEVFVNSITGRYGITANNFGIYVDGKRLVLPMQPNEKWKGFDEWVAFLSALGHAPIVFEEDTNEIWPFGILGRRKISDDKDD